MAQPERVRLSEALALLERAAAVLDVDGDDDDGRLRGLRNDLRYVNARVADRLRRVEDVA